MTDIFEIIDIAHRALRDVDAGDFHVPRLRHYVATSVSHAIAVIEEGRRVLGYRLKEFDKVLPPGDVEG